MNDKFYFFRDLDSGSNFCNGKEFHASGIVEKMYGKTASGKDMIVSYIDIFNATKRSEWRSVGEVHLYEVSDYEWGEANKLLELLNENANG